MKRLTILFCFICLIGKTQNLVPNASFEIKDTCPQDPSKLSYAPPWFQPSNGTPDYYNSCFDSLQTWSSVMDIPQNFIGYQNAKDGVAYTGLYASYPFYSFSSFREYLEVRLSSPLINGQKYFVSFWISLADSSNYAADDIGLAFSNDSILNDTSFILYALPQIENPNGNFIIDKLNWMQVSGEYVATGGEEYIAIGNFKDNSNTDTLHVSGGGDGSPGSQNNAAYYYIDDVCVSTDSLICGIGSGIQEENINVFTLYPNPVYGTLFLEINSKKGGVKIHNNVGEIIFEQTISNSGKYEFDMSNFVNGVYFLQFDTEKEIVIQRFLLIN